MTMAKKFHPVDIARLGDDKALAIAAYGEAVAAYRYIVLAEKARDENLRRSFQNMAQQENSQRDRLRDLLERLFPDVCFFLAAEDKRLVCVGPRLVDARNNERFDEAMKLIIASEKRAISFYSRYAAVAKIAEVRELFLTLTEAGLQRVRQLRELFKASGKQIVESCPLQ